MYQKGVLIPYGVQNGAESFSLDNSPYNPYLHLLKRGRLPAVGEYAATHVPSGATPRHHTPSGRHLLDGGVRILTAEGLLLPAGLLLAAFLTRHLGPHDYGVFTLAVGITTWISSSVNGTFARAAVRCVSEAEHWAPVGATLLRLYGGVSVSAAVLLWWGAPFVASWYAEPALIAPLRILALDIPLFCLAHAHRGILVGIGSFRQRAWLSATRLLAKLILILGLVASGLGLTGALLGSLGASFAELCISRFFVRPSVFAVEAFPVRRLWVYAGPLVLTAFCFNLGGKLDVWLLKGLGGSTADVGFYGAAQQIASAPSLLPVSFSAVLLSSLSRWWSVGEMTQVRQLGRNALRAVLLLFPVAALTAGASQEVVVFALGAPFLPTASLLGILIWGSFAMMLVSVGMVMLIAAGKPRWSLFLAAPLVVGLLIGHLICIPRWGAIGAACVSCGCAFLCALAMLTFIARRWDIRFPLSTCWRSLIICGVAYGLAVAWPVSSFLVLGKLLVLFLLCLGLFFLLGEFSTEERLFLGATFKGMLRVRAA